MDVKHIYRYLAYLLTSKQTDSQSYLDHNADYTQPDFLARERVAQAGNDSKNILKIVGFTSMVTPKFKKMIAVDIGSGAGYYSGKFSKIFKSVIAIEPSSQGQAFAKELYPAKKYPNIDWKNGFAEVELAKISFKEPNFFFTSTVLSHLPDNVVIKICKQVNRAKIGSDLLFHECFGTQRHRYMWHVRTKKWWQTQLPGWKIDFFGEPIQGEKNRRKGFRAIKMVD